MEMESEGSGVAPRETECGRGAALGERNPRCRLYMSLGEDRCELLLGLGTGPLFLEAGFTVYPPPKMNLWSQFL